MRTLARRAGAVADRPTADRRTSAPPPSRRSCRSPTDTESGAPPLESGGGCLSSLLASAVAELRDQCSHLDGGFGGFPALVGRAFSGALERLLRGIGRQDAECHR